MKTWHSIPASRASRSRCSAAKQPAGPPPTMHTRSPFRRRRSIVFHLTQDGDRHPKTEPRLAACGELAAGDQLRVTGHQCNRRLHVASNARIREARFILGASGQPAHADEWRCGAGHGYPNIPPQRPRFAYSWRASAFVYPRWPRPQRETHASAGACLARRAASEHPSATGGAARRTQLKDAHAPKLKRTQPEDM